MHRAIERRCPSLLGLFQKYYNHASIGLYNTGDSVKVINIEEGCRMGCKLSSFGFAITTQDTYESVEEHIKLTGTPEKSFIKAATDDVIMVIKADEVHKEAFYKRVRGLCQKLDIEADKVGLTFNNYKAQLLLPSGWTRPDVGVLPDFGHSNRHVCRC